MDKALAWNSDDNHLILNPRLPADARAQFENAWREHVESKFTAQFGIATSGSSGDSFGKLIVLSKAAVLANARAVNEHFASTSSDTWLKTLPRFHVGGIGIFARAHLSGAKVVESAELRWNPETFHRELTNTKASLLSLVPTQLFDLVHLGLRAPSTLRAVIIGGGRLEAKLHERSLELGWPSHVSYGFTECGSQVATARTPNDERPLILPHAEVKIVDGERIAVKSKALLTAQISFVDGNASLTDPKQDGWFVTEDRGVVEQDRTISILGRTIDFIKIGGEGVLLSRLEGRLESIRASIDSQFDSAILAASDDRLGGKIVLVTTAPEVIREQIVQQFNSGVLPFERIREAFSVGEIPRSELGKLLRARALRLVGLEPLPNV